MSMDTNGKIIWAKHSEVQQANLKAMGDAEIKDGERLPLAVKDMGSCEIYPQTIQHNPNGRSAHPLSLIKHFDMILKCCFCYLFVLFFNWQVCCGLWGRRVYHLHCNGPEE